MMKANEARSIANEARSIDSDYKKVETNQLLAAIKSAAEKGEFGVYVYDSSFDYPVVIERLKKLGYSVSSSCDQRDGFIMTISW